MTRPSLPNGLPTWLTAPDIALPRVQLSPTWGQDTWTASIMIGDLNESHYAETEIDEMCVIDLLADWRISPEACCRKWFLHEPPRGSAPPPDVTPEDLGL